jgi:putative hemolysin
MPNLGREYPFCYQWNILRATRSVENVIVRFETSPTSARDDRQSRESPPSAVIPGCNQPHSARANRISFASGEMIYCAREHGSRARSEKWIHAPRVRFPLHAKAGVRWLCSLARVLLVLKQRNIR